MNQYLDLIDHVRSSESIRMDRTGTGTQGRFGYQMRFNLADGFPLVTTKKVFLKGIIHELLWILAGSTNNDDLLVNGVKIWNEWAHPSGELGPIYGAQWRRFTGYRWVEEEQERSLGELWQEAVRLKRLDLVNEISLLALELGNEIDTFRFPERSMLAESLREAGIATTVVQRYLKEESVDQIAELIHNLKTRPFSRRHVISAWNPAELPNETISPQDNVEEGRMALAPCHCLFQFHVQYRSIEDILPEMSEELQDEYFTLLAEKIDPLPRKDHEAWKEGIRANDEIFQWLESQGVKTKRLNCQLYQR